MQQRPLSPKPAPTGPHRGRGAGALMRLLPWLLILGVLAVGVTIGTSVLRERQIAEDIAPYEGIFADNIAIDGVDISGLSPQDAYNALYAVHQNRISSWSLALTYQGHTYTRLGYPSLGISVSADQINARLREAWDLTHIGDARTKQAAIQKQRTTPFTTYTTGSSMSDTELVRILQAIAQNLDAEPTDAKLIQFAPDLADPFIVQEALPGRKLNVENARDQIIASAASGTSGSYELQPESIAPLITSDQIRQNISLRASAVTAISSSSPDNRNNNIRVSLGRVNGLVLKSGEEFSFNGVAGKRTIENGYYEALEYASRELVTGIGGGVCQSSSTIYQAAVMSRLKITSRTAHSDPVNYTDPGLDATVYWSSGRQIDFKFRNSTNSDIYIAAHVRSDRANAKRLVCEVKIYGESLGEGVRYAMKPVQSETLYPTDEIIYQPDKSLQYVYYKDETKLISEGKEGVVIKTYLEKYIDGTLVERSADPITTDTYRPRQPVYWVGTMPRPK